MRHAQLIVWEKDGQLAEMVREPAQSHQCVLREVRHAEACLQLLRPDSAAIVVLKVGRDLESEFGLVEQITRRFPGTAVVVVADADNASLEGLAWDLGASYVLAPPRPRVWLREIVAGLMAPRRAAESEES